MAEKDEVAILRNAINAQVAETMKYRKVAFEALDAVKQLQAEVERLSFVNTLLRMGSPRPERRRGGRPSKYAKGVVDNMCDLALQKVAEDGVTQRRVAEFLAAWELEIVTGKQPRPGSARLKQLSNSWAVRISKRKKARSTAKN